jgi:AcrR family transcriptional regulator
MTPLFDRKIAHSAYLPRTQCRRTLQAMPQNSEDSEPGGLRSRKAGRTRRRIASEALRLFLERGFEQTTLDEIAEAADISRRTFFHYFSSKQSILEAVDDDVHEAFRTSLAGAAGSTSPLAAVEAALLGMIGRDTSEEAVALDRLMHSTEALRTRKQANYERQERALLDALLSLWPDPNRRPALQIVAMAGIGAMRVATERWRTAPDAQTLVDHLEQAFADLRNEIAS